MQPSSLAQFLANTTLGRDIEQLSAQIAKTGVFVVKQAPSFPCDLTPLFYDQGVTMVGTVADYAAAIVSFFAQHCYQGDLMQLASVYAAIKARHPLYKGFECLAHVLYELQKRVYFTAGAGRVFR